MAANERQVAGEHYMRHGKFQPWDAWMAWRLNPFQAEVLKLIVRYREKNGIQDLHKAIHYLEKLIELETHGAGDLPIDSVAAPPPLPVDAAGRGRITRT